MLLKCYSIIGEVLALHLKDVLVGVELLLFVPMHSELSRYDAFHLSNPISSQSMASVTLHISEGELHLQILVAQRCTVLHNL